VLVSTRDPDHTDLRSYRIVDGEVTEEEVTVVETLPGKAAPTDPEESVQQ
jgi:hypothetical protein